MTATILSLLGKNTDILKVKTFEGKGVSAGLMFFDKYVVLSTSNSNKNVKVTLEQAEKFEIRWKQSGAVMSTYINS